MGAACELGFPMPSFCSQHAIERYRIHHPQAFWYQMRGALRRSVHVERETALAMLGRLLSDRWSGEQWYALAPDRRGLFMITRSRGANSHRFSVVTYIRFGERQRRFAETHWPIEATTPQRAR